MNLVIRNYLAGSFLLEQQPNFWDAIIILDSGLNHTSFVADHARKFIYLQFDDVSADRHGKRTPTLEDVRETIEFSSGSENLLVCCRAGQSRSAAIAFVIACHRISRDAACEMLNPERHIPNPLIVNLGAKLIDDPEVFQSFAAWQTLNKDIKLSDYLDEIERELDELERQGARNRIVSS